MTNLIASSILLDINVSDEITKSETVNYWWLLGIRKLIIIKVLKGETEELFTNLLFRDHVLKNTQLSNKIVFLFDESTLNEVVSMFRLYNILITGGSSSKRHLLSPLELRLSRVILPLELTRS